MDAKVQDIISAVQEELRSSCRCDITRDTIAPKSVLLCADASSNYITFRSGLTDTPEADSHTLISNLEKWASGGPSVRVQGFKMKVDSECPVPITSFNDNLCTGVMATTTANETPTTQLTSRSESSTDSTGAIIGGVLAVVVIVALIIVLILVWRGCHGDWLLFRQSSQQ